MRVHLLSKWQILFSTKKLYCSKLRAGSAQNNRNIYAQRRQYNILNIYYYSLIVDIPTWETSRPVPLSNSQLYGLSEHVSSPFTCCHLPLQRCQPCRFQHPSRNPCHKLWLLPRCMPYWIMVTIFDKSNIILHWQSKPCLIIANQRKQIKPIIQIFMK